jgi:hypothetical protein
MIRVFVGCAPNNDDLESQAVLEWSLRRHTSRPLEITWMQLSRDPASPFYSDGPRGWQTQFWTTPFSGLRWAVPELCGFKGEAIYCDSDIIFFADIGLLWDESIKSGKIAIAKGGAHGQRFCVSKWDCREAQRYLPSIAKLQQDPYSHYDLMECFYREPLLFQQFGTGNWNCLDLDDYLTLADPDMRALHYTGIPTQPQLRYALPRLFREGGAHWFKGEPRPHPHPDIERIFDLFFREAIAAGYGIDRYRRQPYGELRIRHGR